MLFQGSWKRSYSCSSAHLAADGNGTVEDAVHAQDGRLWRVDDGRAEHGAEHAAVADSEGASVHVLNGQLVLTRLQGEEAAASLASRRLASVRLSGIEVTKLDLFPQRIDGLLDVGKVHGLNIADDWYDESLHTQRERERQCSGQGELNC